jgi:tryptophan synthase beta chain
MKRFFSRDEKYLPEYFYNIKADLKENLMPPLHPGTKDPLAKSDMEMIFSKGYIEHETTLEKFVKIPDVVREKYKLYRPTPLIYATGLKQFLDTPADIFYKYEGVSPTGSHKTNTALMQAYLASQEGIKSLTTETGAGQWGSALSHAGAIFGIDVDVYMVRVSYNNKPGRRTMIEMHGGNVFGSPSQRTQAGLSYYNQNAEHPGSLGIAISEAIESAVMKPGVKYSLGSVLDGVLLHQTIIGQEAISQLKEAGAYPDVIIGCAGGGSNFAGIAFPFMNDKMSGKTNTEFIAVEPDVCPSLTKGELRYDFGDSTGLTPLLYMHTLGKDFIPPSIHAGGLRYHGMAPLVSHLYDKGYMCAESYSQDEAFKAARIFQMAEGILPAPESSHAIAAVIKKALQAKKENKKINILFNLSGHGYFDISAFATN